MLRKVKQLLSNFEAERWENLSNLRLAKKSVAYKKTLVYKATSSDPLDQSQPLDPTLKFSCDPIIE